MKQLLIGDAVFRQRKEPVVSALDRLPNRETFFGKGNAVRPLVLLPAHPRDIPLLLKGIDHPRYGSLPDIQLPRQLLLLKAVAACQKVKENIPSAPDRFSDSSSPLIICRDARRTPFISSQMLRMDNTALQPLSCSRIIA